MTESNTAKFGNSEEEGNIGGKLTAGNLHAVQAKGTKDHSA